MSNVDAVKWLFALAGVAGDRWLKYDLRVWKDGELVTLPAGSMLAGGPGRRKRTDEPFGTERVNTIGLANGQRFSTPARKPQVEMLFKSQLHKPITDRPQLGTTYAVALTLKPTLLSRYVEEGRVEPLGYVHKVNGRWGYKAAIIIRGNAYTTHDTTTFKTRRDACWKLAAEWAKLADRT
jgi:hypothetical protein